MKYAFYFYDEYTYRQKTSTRNLPLYDLFECLDSKGHSYWVRLSEDEYNSKKIIIWSSDNIKEALMSESFANYDLFLDYVPFYHTYSRKRFAEMPAIRIWKDNYDFLEQQWQDIWQRTPKYLIFREHDNGFVDILEKEELSPEDIVIMNREHKIYQNYIKRWDTYFAAHPEKRYPVWRSEADNLFESDFALYDPVDEEGVDEI